MSTPEFTGNANARLLTPEQVRGVDACIARAGAEIGSLLEQQTIEAVYKSVAMPPVPKRRIQTIAETAYPPIPFGDRISPHPFAIALQRGLTIGYLFGMEFKFITGQRDDRYEDFQTACLDSMLQAVKNPLNPQSPDMIVSRHNDIFDTVYEHLPLAQLDTYPAKTQRVKQFFADSVAYMAANGVAFLVAEVDPEISRSSQLAHGFRVLQLHMRPDAKPFVPVHDTYPELPQIEG